MKLSDAQGIKHSPAEHQFFVVFVLFFHPVSGPPCSDEHWNRFKGNVGKTSEIRGGAHNMGFPELIDTVLNRTELN